eukprot:4452658-Prymnesium_polylepis.1
MAHTAGARAPERRVASVWPRDGTVNPSTVRCISRHHDVVRSSKQSLRYRKRLEKILLIRYSRLSALADFRRVAKPSAGHRRIHRTCE